MRAGCGARSPFPASSGSRGRLPPENPSAGSLAFRGLRSRSSRALRVVAALAIVLAGCSSSARSAARPSPGSVAPSTAGRAAATRVREGVLPRSYRTIARRRQPSYDGTVFAFGRAPFEGSTASSLPSAPVVAIASAATGRGYWLAASDGGVFAFGAPFEGSLAGRRLGAPIVGIGGSGTGLGYWLVARDGGVFSFGDARYHGSLGKRRLVAPVVALVPTPDGTGYWLVASDGGVFSFGGARYFGSIADRRLSAPVVGMAATSTGRGYWLVASDGEVFGFGDARVFAPPRSRRVAAPVVGIARAPGNDGYWLAEADGAVVAFGHARMWGSASGELPASSALVQIAGIAGGGGYRLLAAGLAARTAGGVTAIGDSVMIDAAAALRARIPGVNVDAAVSRQVGDGVASLSELAAAGQLGETLVWHLGTNGTFTAGDLDRVLRLAAGRHVIVLTDHCGYCGWTAANNATIYAGCVAARHCTVADWNARANANPTWFGADGVHMPIGGAGAQAYAALVVAAL